MLLKRLLWEQEHNILHLDSNLMSVMLCYYTYKSIIFAFLLQRNQKSQYIFMKLLHS